MTEFIINNDGVSGKIKGGVFCYVKLQTGDFKYQSKTEKEYTVDVVVTKAVAKAYKKAFPKNGYKEIDSDEFEGIFKIKPPFEGDEQYVIKLKANAQVRSDIPGADLRAGDYVPYTWKTRPKCFVPCDGGVKDVTMSVLVSNGSRGDVAFRITENSYGKFPQLTGILVTELIEYKKEGDNDTDFGNLVGDLDPGDGNPQQVATETIEEEPKTEETANDVSVGDDIPDDDIPF